VPANCCSQKCARGSGKTTIASRLVRRFSDLADSGWIVLAHHAGAGNAEFSIKAVLRRFCGELCQHMRVYAPIPEGNNFVDSHLRELLVKATSVYGANVLLVIDGYDQMDNSDLTHSHTWIPQGEILGLHIVLTLEESTLCHARILSRVDDCAEINMAQLEAKETQELAEGLLTQLLPGFEPQDLPIHDLVLASQLNLRTPLWMVTACRVIKGMVELYGFMQFSPDDACRLPLSSSLTRRDAAPFLLASSRFGARSSRCAAASFCCDSLCLPLSLFCLPICLQPAHHSFSAPLPLRTGPLHHFDTYALRRQQPRGHAA